MIRRSRLCHELLVDRRLMSTTPIGDKYRVNDLLDGPQQTSAGVSPESDPSGNGVVLIASWDAKYEYDLWRPIDAIRRADIDGNDSTVADTTWIPLLKTPPFPKYTSRHITFSGAASAVLNAFFGTNHSFTSRADGHNGPSQRPLDPSVVTSRNFVNFDQAVEEAGNQSWLSNARWC